MDVAAVGTAVSAFRSYVAAVMALCTAGLASGRPIQLATAKKAGEPLLGAFAYLRFRLALGVARFRRIEADQSDVRA